MSPTTVVELTSPGRAAVAVVLVAGPDAMQFVNDCFTPVSARRWVELPVGRIALGHWGGADGEELIACRRGEREIEIHCHGGTAAVRAVVDRLVERGCRAVTWRQWLRFQHRPVSPIEDSPGRKLGPASRASESPRDATTCAAQIALASATTGRTAATLLDQYHGALSTAIHAACSAIDSADWVQADAIVENVLRFRHLGLHLSTPWRVVIAGSPNVGKSSLMNALAGYQRAIVAPLPGTTRDVVTFATAIDGWPVEFADTAGLRTAEDELESAGVALAEGAIAEADLVIRVADASSQVDAALKIDSRISTTARLMRVWNKIDLLSPPERSRLKSVAANPQSAFLNPQFASALTGQGIADLTTAIGTALVPLVPPPAAAVPFTVQQISGLDVARAAIERRDAIAVKEALNALLAE
jgi:tRNA modification GTPase